MASETYTTPENERYLELQKEHGVVHAEFTQIRTNLHLAESTRAAATAQYDEACKLAATGKDADPTQFKNAIDQAGHRIHGLKQALADVTAKLAPIAADLQHAVIQKQKADDASTAQRLLQAHREVLDRISAAELAIEPLHREANAKYQELQQFRWQQSQREQLAQQQLIATRQGQR
jgi:hypothetical protein